MKSVQKYPKPLITQHNFEAVLESSLGEEWMWQVFPPGLGAAQAGEDCCVKEDFVAEPWAHLEEGRQQLKGDAHSLQEAPFSISTLLLAAQQAGPWQQAPALPASLLADRS